MPTMRDVARHANVSIATVSHVINDTRPVSAELRQRVQQAMAELGYHRNTVARALRSKRSLNIPTDPWASAPCPAAARRSR